MDVESPVAGPWVVASLFVRRQSKLRGSRGQGRCNLIWAPHLGRLRLRSDGAPMYEFAIADACHASSLAVLLGRATGATRSRGLSVILVALAVACDEPATSDTQRLTVTVLCARRRRRNRRVSRSLPARQIRCSSRTSVRLSASAPLKSLIARTSDGSGDVSGFTIGRKRVSITEWVVSGSEAIGSLGAHARSEPNRR